MGDIGVYPAASVRSLSNLSLSKLLGCIMRYSSVPPGRLRTPPHDPPKAVSVCRCPHFKQTLLSVVSAKENGFKLAPIASSSLSVIPTFLSRSFAFS